MSLTMGELARRVGRELVGARVWLSPSLDPEFVAALPDTIRPVSGTMRADVAVVAAQRLSVRGELMAKDTQLPRAARVLGVLWLARGAAVVRGPLVPSAGRAERAFTELGVLDVTPQGLVLVELAAGVSATDLQELCEPTLLISARLSEMTVDERRTEQ